MKALIALLIILICFGQSHPYSQLLSGKMAKLSAAIYNITKSDQIRDRCRDCYEGFKVLKQLQGDNILVMIGIDRKQKEIVVVFRGTTNLPNWLTDIDILMTEYDQDPKKCKKCKVHHGFYSSFKSLDTHQAQTIIKRTVKDNPSYGIIFTGHSLGGAMANLAAVKFRQRYPKTDLKVYTFGQPRVGNQNYAAYASKKLPVYYRTVHKKDLVPHKPAQLIYYRHSGFEIWYKEGMDKKYRKCQEESQMCSNSLGIFNHDYSVNDHHSGYYAKLSEKVSSIIEPLKKKVKEGVKTFFGKKKPKART